MTETIGGLDSGGSRGKGSGGERKGRTGGWQAPPWLRRVFLVLGVIVVVGALVIALRPQPVSVDLAPVTRGTVEVAVEEDGRTRVRDRYVVSVPVAANLRRITLRPGDVVEAGDDLARLDGPESPLNDPRSQAQLQARLAAAEAGVERARAMSEAAAAGMVEAQEELRRQEILLDQGGGSSSAVERARAFLRVREAEARSGEFGIRAAQGEVDDLRAALRPGAGASGNTGSLLLSAPVAGVVLRVHRESGGAVAPGEPLMEVGDPAAMEVVVDLLSADAVRVSQGAEAWIRGWGGDDELPARVSRVEPSGFTQVSALGIEEQRVNVILEPMPHPDWSRLGDGFRVEARILVDRAQGVLRVPAGALFRNEDAWAAFRARGDRLEEVQVEVGRRSQAEAEVLSGLEEEDRVVIYPGDQVTDGVGYRVR